MILQMRVKTLRLVLCDMGIVVNYAEEMLDGM